MTEALAEEGLVPKECVNIQIDVRADSVTTLKYEVVVENVDLEKLGRAFTKAGELQIGESTMKDGKIVTRYE